MTSFEKQGQSATSCEPFFEWCEENGIDLRVSAAMTPAQQRSAKIWNQMLTTTEQGDLEEADELLGLL